MDSAGMMYITKFMTISSGIQVILRILSEQFERLCSVGITVGRDL
jgi:hypothetical protein